MTISRCSAALVALFAVACSATASTGDDGRPPANTELGRIVRISKFEEAAGGLQRFAETRLNNRAALRAQFVKAGFKRSVYVDGPDNSQCEQFGLKTHEVWPSVYLVSICEGKVYASAGQQAP
jgi:hypothetical protein